MDRKSTSERIKMKKERNTRRERQREHAASLIGCHMLSLLGTLPGFAEDSYDPLLYRLSETIHGGTIQWSGQEVRGWAMHGGKGRVETSRGTFSSQIYWIMSHNQRLTYWKLLIWKMFCSLCWMILIYCIITEVGKESHHRTPLFEVPSLWRGAMGSDRKGPPPAFGCSCQPCPCWLHFLVISSISFWHLGICSAIHQIDSINIWIIWL